MLCGVARPELFRLIADSRPDDVLLIEQVDRLSRLTATDWQSLTPFVPTPSGQRRAQASHPKGRSVAKRPDRG
jgi:hypothetical protein